MTRVAGSIRVLEGVDPRNLPLDELQESNRPAVLKGLVSDWKLVHAASRGDRAAMEYLRSFYNGRPVQYSYGEPSIAGRPFYNDDFTELNCIVRRDRLDEVLRQIETHLGDQEPPTYYVASLPVDACLPGFSAENDVGLTARGIDTQPSIWIGNRTVASCHFDAPSNLTCCATGRRRFTVFPPEQVFNLYPGPLEPTPGGQAVSAVDFSHPDFGRHPRFREALAAGQTAEVEPGDAVFIPSMWWHHVDGLGPFNVLVNYWWSSVPAFIPTPHEALYHLIWSLRDRPEREKKAWRHVFDYYVFGRSDRAGAHLPAPARGVLGPIDEGLARQIRARLINKLNR